MKDNFCENERLLSLLFGSVILFGAFLAIYQFALNRSLWYDEAMLALNIINKDFHALAKPLDDKQVAPIGFLFMERLFVLMLGKNEFSLRIFPLLGFLASIPLFYGLAKRLAEDHIIAMMATSMFGITLSLLDYSAEVKQYSTDVLFTLLILHAALSLELRRNRSLAVLALVGSISIWFSNVAVVSLFVAGLYLLHSETYRRKNYRIFLPLLCWSASFLAYYFFFAKDHPAKTYMVAYWEHAFLPLNLSAGNSFNFLISAAKEIHGRLLGFGHSWWIAFLISFCGVAFSLRRKNHKPVYFCLAPTAVHLLLSGLKLYPFSGRFILYTAPLSILLLAIGTHDLFDIANKKTRGLRPNFLLLLPLIVLLLPLYKAFPVEKEEIKKSLNYIQKAIKSDEAIYLYKGSQKAFEFYRQTNMINMKNKTILGTFFKGNRIGDDEIMKFDGKVWLVFSHVYPFKKDSGLNEDRDLLQLLQNKGARLLDAKSYRGSNIYYLDATASHTPPSQLSGPLEHGEIQNRNSER